MLNTRFTLNYCIQNNYNYVRVRELSAYWEIPIFLRVKFVWVKQILIKFNISEFHEKLSSLFICHMSTNYNHKYTLRNVVNAFLHVSR
jgi:hypothetical protein